MRFKKHRRHRKAVRLYTTCFGFREPFKVLCDGTFIHHLVSNHIVSEKAVSNTLGGSVQLFTTRCIIEELKSLGSSHAESFHAARKDYKLARCEHDTKRSALDCIIEVIRESNPEHFFVATQDFDLRKTLRKVPGVPLIFGLRNALFLEQLSSVQREFVKSAEEERLHMTDLEYKMLQKRVNNTLNTEEVKDTCGAEEGTGDEFQGDHVLANRKISRKRMDMKDMVQFKRKKAKGPNPLSCKKKKNPASLGPKAEKDNKADSDAKRNKPRKRKRSCKAKTSTVSDGANS